MIRTQATIAFDEDALITAVADAFASPWPDLEDHEDRKETEFRTLVEEIPGLFKVGGLAGYVFSPATLLQTVATLDAYCAWLSTNEGDIELRPTDALISGSGSWEEERDAARTAQSTIADFHARHADLLEARAELFAAQERLESAVTTAFVSAVEAHVGDAVRAFAAGEVHLDPSVSLVEACVDHVRAELESSAFSDRWKSGYADAHAALVAAADAAKNLPPVDDEDPAMALLHTITVSLAFWTPPASTDVDDRAPEEQ